MVGWLSDAARNVAKPVWPVKSDQFEHWLKTRSEQDKAWVSAVGFKPEYGKLLLVPGRDGFLAGVVLCLGDEPDLWAYAAASQGLPEGHYFLDLELEPAEATLAVAGWGLGAYSFDQCRTRKAGPVARLVSPKEADLEQARRTVEAQFMVRDMINTPAADMGPEELTETARDLAKRFGARVEAITGDDLLVRNFPAIYQVGRGSVRQPRLIDLCWGEETAPKVTLVGKGLCFDSGGLDLKPAANMRFMKKDMSGAAHALGVARMVMDAGLPVRLRVLIPAVENMPSGNSYRPGDVIKTRKGLTVEVTNTDAEGRIVLSDALFEGASDRPDLMIDFATLTGSATIALGPSLPAMFCRKDSLAADMERSGRDQADPVWRLPLWKPYRKFLDSDVADIRNSVTEHMHGGSITAALFLSEFVDETVDWVHLDHYAYIDKQQPGRKPGGEAMGLRAAYGLMAGRFGN